MSGWMLVPEALTFTPPENSKHQEWGRKEKEKKNWKKKECGRTPDTGVYTIWFHVYKTLENENWSVPKNANQLGTRKKLCGGRNELQGEYDVWGWDRNLWCLDHGGSFIGVYFVKMHQIAHFRCIYSLQTISQYLFQNDKNKLKPIQNRVREQESNPSKKKSEDFWGT